MRQAFNKLHIKGSFLVIKNGQPWLNYATANKLDTSYLINSVQKSMTATMVMREVQNHKLKLSTKIKTFYPTIPGGSKISIEDLLTMKSGLNLKPGESLGTDIFYSDKDNLKSDLKKTVFDEKKLGKWHYTSLNYVYLCGIISKLENEDYEKLFRATFIDKFNLKNTEFLWSNMSDLQASNLVPGYHRHHGKYIPVDYQLAVKEAHDELGAGSIVMSNHDLAVVVHAILAGKLLNKASRRALFKGMAPKYYNGGFYNIDGIKKANGAGMGYYTFLRASNNGKNMIIIQTNKMPYSRFGEIKDKLDGLVPLIFK